MSLPTRAGVAAWASQSAAKTGLGDIVDAVVGALGGKPSTELTISSGAVTASSTRSGDSGASATPVVTIDTEGDAASDTLDTIDVTEFDDGQFILVGLENAARLVTLNDSAGGAGQMYLKDNLAVVLSAVDQWILFYIDKSGTAFLQEVARFGFDNSDRVSVKTANYDIEYIDHNRTYANTGAAGTINGTLPAGRAGMEVTFVVTEAQLHQVVPDSGAETLYNSSTGSTTGWKNNTVGSSITFKCINSTTWVATSVVGTWTAV